MRSANENAGAPLEDIPDLTKMIQRARDGDADAVSLVIEQVTGHIQSMVRRIRGMFPGVKHLENTEADTTEVFLRLLVKNRPEARPFNSRREFRNACYSTARNLLIDRLRWYQRQVNAMDGLVEVKPEREEIDPAQQAENADELKLLRVTLESLDGEEYALVSMIYFEGLNQSDAFRQMDLPESTGRHKLQKIKTKLAKAMS